MLTLEVLLLLRYVHNRQNITYLNVALVLGISTIIFVGSILSAVTIVFDMTISDMLGAA